MSLLNTLKFLRFNFCINQFKTTTRHNNIAINMQNPIPLAVFYVNASNREEASKLSAILVEKKLIACCNIVDNVTSVYEWQGKMENSQ
jgi:hypothetical protein